MQSLENQLKEIQSEENETKTKVDEWRLLSRILDRLCIMIYSVAIVYVAGTSLVYRDRK